MSPTRLGTYSATKGTPVKIPCRVASTGNIASLSGLLTVDSVTVSAGDRVLVWTQSTPSQNNIYVASSGAWTVALDMSLASDIFIGMKVYIYDGSTYLKKTFALTVVSPVTFVVETTSGGESTVVEAKNSGYTITTADVGKTFTCNSSSAQTFLLPSVGAGELGYGYTVTKLGAGQVTITAADSDTIEDSGAGAGIYCADGGIATIQLKLVSLTQWIIKSANGVWITTT